MQDNTLVRTLRMAGEDAVLVPTYTPIRVDEDDVSVDRVFMGGINVYLSSVVPGWRFLPDWMTGWLNKPSIIQGLSKFGSTDASRLGSLTLDMLRGSAGPQRREIRQFVNYLCSEVNPDVIIFSNALLSGVLSELRDSFPGPILCLLQGDDIFLEALSDRWKPRVMDQLKQNCAAFDGFLTHSRYYRDFMASYLGLSVNDFRQIPLTVDSSGFDGNQHLQVTQEPSRPIRIGYFARICPEKGIQNLLNAADQILSEVANAEIAIAGYLPGQHEKWFRDLLHPVQEQFPGRVNWLGSPADRHEKITVFRSFDVLCVPTSYHEPKGLYVLEAGLAGVSSVVPDHGAFPELVEDLNCGCTYDASRPDALASTLIQFISHHAGHSVALPERIELQHGMKSTGRIIRQAISEFASKSDAQGGISAP